MIGGYGSRRPEAAGSQRGGRKHGDVFLPPLFRFKRKRAVLPVRQHAAADRRGENRELPDFDLSIRRVSYEDGCKVYFDGAWVIIRFSGTEPRVRIFAEDATVERAEALVNRVACFLGLK